MTLASQDIGNGTFGDEKTLNSDEEDSDASSNDNVTFELNRKSQKRESEGTKIYSEGVFNLDNALNYSKRVSENTVDFTPKTYQSPDKS